MATRKLLIPTKIGSFCVSKRGGKTGSGAMYISTTRKVRVNTTDNTSGTTTKGSSHCDVPVN